MTDTKAIQAFIAADKKRTQGEWDIHSKFVGPLHIEADGVTIAHVGADDFTTASANAAFIAAASLAAPALLEVLAVMKQMQEALAYSDKWVNTCDANNPPRFSPSFQVIIDVDGNRSKPELVVDNGENHDR